MFQLTKDEKDEVVAICDHLEKLKYSPTLPYAFTEHGAIMLANVLNSRTAIEASVQVVRSFVRLRLVLSPHKELTKKIDYMEKKYDAQFRAVFDAIRQLIATPPKNAKKIIGFGKEE
ncbi:MAG: hypothetical protein HY807_09280 [Nitrospirae bacterium]|nr:hypothetical protein [Nitrospirota bacterium]